MKTVDFQKLLQPVTLKLVGADILLNFLKESDY